MNRDGKKPRGLSQEDQALWQEIGESVKPLKKPVRIVLTAPPAAKSAMRESKVKPTGALRVEFAEPYFPPVSRPGSGGQSPSIDDKTARKLSRGRMAIDATLDLHGRTEAQAYQSLLRFVERSVRLNHKLLLVITGKGERSGSVLRQAAPRWLGEPPLAQFIGGVRQAAAPHGAQGALYVRLRSKKPAAGARN